MVGRKVEVGVRELEFSKNYLAPFASAQTSRGKTDPRNFVFDDSVVNALMLMLPNFLLR